MQCRSCDAELTPGARFCSACAAPAPAASADPGDTLRTALETALGFQYRVERLLGRGGMGAVYLANELALDREVAIKVLPPDRGRDEDGRARFRREARTAARLSHPNVVPLLTFGEVNGLAYFVMGYVRGESLAARMRREGRLGSDAVTRILADVADALDYAHRHGVVHRDIKPDNVLLDEESGRAMLTDFGIARARGSETLTSTGMIVGTPRYMSPEQVAGSGELDGRSDLYSLGLIGYEMLTGKEPFAGRTPSEQLLQRVSRDPTPLHSRAPDTPGWLTSAIGRCLERDPAARWPDGGSFRDVLRSGAIDSDLPSALRHLGFFAQASFLAWMFGVGIVAWDLATDSLQRWFFYEGRFDPEPSLFAVAMTFPLLGLLALKARRAGQPWRAIGAALVRQPAWWVGYYPRGARAPGDVWDRLPRHVRVARTLLLLGPFVWWYVLVMAEIDRTGLEQYEREGRWTGLAAFRHARHWDDGRLIVWPFMGFLTAVAFACVRSFRVLRRGPLAGLLPADVAQVFTRSTGSRRFWARPMLAGLLLPHPESRSRAAAPALEGAAGTEDVTSTKVESGAVAPTAPGEGS